MRLPNLRDEAREGVPARNAAAPGSEDAASTAMSTGRTVEIISVALWRDWEGGPVDLEIERWKSMSNLEIDPALLKQLPLTSAIFRL